MEAAADENADAADIDDIRVGTLKFTELKCMPGTFSKGCSQFL